MLKPKHLVRYKDIGLLLVKHGRVGLGGSDAAEDADDESLQQDAQSLAEELEELGPTFVKLGQLLSTRADLLPEPYQDELARLTLSGAHVDSAEFYRAKGKLYARRNVPSRERAYEDPQIIIVNRSSDHTDPHG